MYSRKYRGHELPHTHHNRKQDFDQIKHTKNNWFFNPKNNKKAGDKLKATARLTRLLTNHTSIGKFRQRFNLEELTTCYACDENKLETRNHIIFECTGWQHQTNNKSVSNKY